MASCSTTSFSLSLVVLWAACSGPPKGPGQPEIPATRLDLSAARFVDLTHPFDEQTVYWPTAPSGFELQQLAYGPTQAGYFYSANAFSTPEHGGTHLDAPIHFAEAGWSADRIPVEQLIGSAVVIDVSRQAAENRDYRLTAEDVLAWEERNGPVAAGSVVMLRTGWARHWPDRETYLGDDTPGDASNLHFPSYGEAAARVLVEDRKVAVLGVDTASIDYGPSTDFIVHQIASGRNVSGLENVAGLEQMPETGAWVIAMPVKIAGGSGGPVRILGVLWD